MKTPSITSRKIQSTNPPAGALRVFVSSTFRDMHAERDLLVRAVFPQVRQQCERFGGTAVEIDLRWGITREESEQRKVVPLCLAEIRDCSYTIVLLGDLYGSRCSVDDLPADCHSAYPWLTECDDRSYTEIEIEAALFRRPEARDRTICYCRQSAKKQLGSVDDQARLSELKNRLRTSGVTWRDYDSAEQFAEFALADLTRFATEITPADSTDSNRSHTAYARVFAGEVLGRDNWFARLDAAARNGRNLIIRGPTGVGKTALLAAWLARELPLPAQRWWQKWLGEGVRPWLVFTHFVGADDLSGRWPHLLDRLIRRLRDATGLTWPIPTTAARLAESLPHWLNRVVRVNRLLLVVDGLDRLAADDAGGDFSWLPTTWPRWVSVLATVNPGAAADRLAKLGWPVSDLEELQPVARTAVVDGFLQQYGKRLEPNQETLTTSPSSGNPLFLITAAEELRVVGSREELPGRLAECVATDLPGLFGLVVERWSANRQDGRPGVVRRSLELVAAARHGLSEAELLDLLGEGQPLPSRWWAEARAVIGRGIWDFQGVLRFAHPALHAAIKSRLTTETMEKARTQLIEYFSADISRPRAMAELPWLLIHLAHWDKLASVLGDQRFLATALPTYATEVMAYWGVLGQHRPQAVKIQANRLAVDPAAPWPAAALLLELGFPRQALTIAERYRDDTELGPAATSGLIADCRHKLGDLAGTLEALAEQERHLPSSDGLARAANQIARASTHRAVGDAITAERLLSEAAINAARDEWISAEWHAAAAALEIGRKRYRRAVHLLRREVSARRLLGDLANLGLSLGNLGVALRGSRCWQEAINSHEEEERLCRRLADRAGLQRSLGNQAAIRMDQAKYDAAHELIERRLVECQDLQGAALVDAFRQRAFFLGVKLGQHQLALVDTLEALRLAGLYNLPTDEIRELLRYLNAR